MFKLLQAITNKEKRAKTDLLKPNEFENDMFLDIFAKDFSKVFTALKAKKM